MRLLNTRTLTLMQFDAARIPAYAILSHRWGADEVTLEDITLERQTRRSGFGKLRSFCEVAAKDGFEYCWMDTCCINKTSSAELSEAINSMFQWYRNATVCYAYLQDVHDGEEPRYSTSLFRRSEWFKRGWTLQELIAPGVLYFYSSNWTRIGSRSSLIQPIAEITGIHTAFFKTGDLSKYSAAQKMAWAAERKCTRIEDEAYSLLGLFGINMSLLYGEGTNAFHRLQEQILTRTGDYSILAHAEEEPVSQLRLFKPKTLAVSPYSFRGSLQLERVQELSEHFTHATSTDVTITPGGVRLPMWLISSAFFPGKLRTELNKGREGNSNGTSQLHLALLGYGPDNGGLVAAILLQEMQPGIYEKQRLKIYEDGFCMVARDLMAKAELKTIVLRHSIVRLPEEWTFDKRHHHLFLDFPPPEVLGFALQKSVSPTNLVSDATAVGEAMRVQARMNRHGHPVSFTFLDDRGLGFTLSISRLSQAPFINMQLSTEMCPPTGMDYKQLPSPSVAGKRQSGGEYLSTTILGMDRNTNIELEASRQHSGWSVQLRNPVSSQPLSSYSPAHTTTRTFESTMSDATTLNTSASHLHTWLGHVATEHYTSKYVKLRHELSDAAYWGNWPVLFDRIEDGRHIYNESWVNAPRMKPIPQITSLTMWTPLHQAVYMDAPMDVVQRLIDLGASRSLRTKQNSFDIAPAQLTPLDLARQIGRLELEEILRPVKEADISLEVLHKLETHFHNLIHLEAGPFVKEAKLYLPNLTYLIELGSDQVWFPIQLDYKSAGYIYQLVGQELRVKSINIQGEDDEISYNIVEDGVSWID